ncbi:hypothetical protein [Rivularia sp. UHCC 0363]|uniref:hypothetical protein n=1 Tax=Rivularia sp. UHCC 0363 TaxID=3110244 RepID=UPI002B1EB513|nr:hypothetical protein [Rivularia sp. UHCC 0363]MEA5593377.1 hypothetical protein [Rivularia sp. UHCC 0363]
MTTNKSSIKNNKNIPIPGHPLAKIAGKFGGEFWESTLKNIQDFREREKQEINDFLDNEN